ncbi:hypothetical protein AMATHDRAFT_139083 [Amanita thiersii Skay4041]|uniref:EF-hand domain-containing protein n=1 Tax=Amanita thiersii Skay4041 TaxID=703135 RepID=A0A2A9NY59_9AGAR|nr:hypothetical protein AMATHDRAFT_139083 [Amanita thiersii Skay4041]
MSQPQSDIRPDFEQRTRPNVHYSTDLSQNKPFPISRTRTDTLDLPRPSSLAVTDDADNSTDYDWSAEEDLVDEEAKLEKKLNQTEKTNRFGIKRIFLLLFSSLIGSTFLSALLVAPGILVHFFWYRENPTEHRKYVKDNVQSWLFWAAANLLISWYLGLFVNLVPFVIRSFISAFWGHVSESVKTRLELYTSVKDTFKPVLYAASGWISWAIIFGGVYDLYDQSDPTNSRAPYLYRIAQVVEFVFFLALAVCIQRMLVHAITFAFHRTAYHERVECVRESLKVIERLRQYRPKPTTPRPKSGSHTPVLTSATTSAFSEKEHFTFLSNALRAATFSESRKDRYSADAQDPDTDEYTPNTSRIKGKGRMHFLSGDSQSMGSRFDTQDPERQLTPRSSPHSGPSTPAGSRPGTPYHFPPSRKQTPKSSPEDSSNDSEPALTHAAKVFKHAILHDARNLRGNSDGLNSLSWNITSSQEAKRLARAIYTRFKQRQRNYLLPSDFYPAFPDREVADAAFRVFDKDNNGDVSRAEIKTTLIKVYKERRFLARSIRDVGQALKTLDRILLFFAFVVLFFISLSVFGVNIGKSLTSIYSIFIAASFVFKNAASSAFDAIMFLFVTHPFDTGDRCFIDNENLVVKKMGLFATVFARADGTETYYFNSQLFNKFITNVRRSGNTFENLTMQVTWRTPLEKLDELERRLNRWLSTEENRWFEPSTSIMIQHIMYQRYMEITISIGHNGNWQDWGLRLTRKTAFHAAVQYYCRQLGIVGYEAPLPIVYGDPNTEGYGIPPMPPIPSDDYLRPPPGTLGTMEQVVEEEPQKVEPVLGFLPPFTSRSSNLRARKSKSRKLAYRAGHDG